ncbi:ABC transporter ATP-binding protein [Romboutsia sp.]|uniref:ABC transporter ATP-binding protein n=1 Tax=Romboutsia sp. TaxID=1965302 RepID=UPI002C096EF8|nr:ABC transporter ATP-binding protein [Romboutsia sp.]HSQ88238.1 ABC transporter ATP-binding protein [Romboutsia sp.]
MEDKVLKIKNLSVEFSTSGESFKVVNDVNLELEKGEILGLVGESGCGKTTTALSILGLLPKNAKITGGEILFEGKNLLLLSKEELRKIRGKDIGIISQNSMSNLNPIRKIKKQFIESIRTHVDISKKEAHEIACEMLQKVNLSDPERIMNQYSFQLSGGMRQRVMIAMAIALRPKILIADEPTTALDVTVQAQILEEIDKLRKDFGISIIFVSHNLGIISQLADRIGVMYAGEIVEYGFISSVFNNPIHPYTKGLLESVPKIENAKKILKAIRGNPPDLSKKHFGCLFYPRCDYVMDTCRCKKPKLIKIKEDSMGACHLINKNSLGNKIINL